MKGGAGGGHFLEWPADACFEDNLGGQDTKKH
jgi:hypothetical protein